MQPPWQSIAHLRATTIQPLSQNLIGSLTHPNCRGTRYKYNKSTLENANSDNGTASSPTKTASAAIQAGSPATRNALRRTAASLIQAAGSSGVSRDFWVAIRACL